MKKVIRVTNLDCANCAAKLERALGKIDGISDVSVSFLTQKISLEISPETSCDEVIAEVKRVCRKVEPDVTLCLA